MSDDNKVPYRGHWPLPPVMTDDELISLFEKAGDYALLGDVQKTHLIALARDGVKWKESQNAKNNPGRDA